MCGGEYKKWEVPRQLTEINGEPIVARTIRLLRENGIEDIAISSNNPVFEKFGVPVLKHQNNWNVRKYNDSDGYWCECFYTDEKLHSATYLMGDVVFSRQAIKTIVETNTDDIEFFASSIPLSDDFFKASAEPFAFKVVNMQHLKNAIAQTICLDRHSKFKRVPIAWEFWQVVKGTKLNVIDYTNYTAINDYTCDIDDPEDIKYFNQLGDKLNG